MMTFTCKAEPKLRGLVSRFREEVDTELFGKSALISCPNYFGIVSEVDRNRYLADRTEGLSERPRNDLLVGGISSD